MEHIFMTKQEVIEHFGSAANAARALRLSRAAVTLWPDTLSEHVAYKVELATKGALKTEETKRLLNVLEIGD
jgi:DNA-binding transcriptional regulator Cro